MITVSEGIANHYGMITGVRPDVILSAKRERAANAPEARSSARIRLLYHGGTNGDRSVESLIALADQLDERFELDLYLMGDPGRIAALRTLAEGTRCSILDPVPSDRLIELGEQYDMGLVLYEAKNLNLKHCMPNKLFEYMNSGLAVVCGPIEDAARMVIDGGFGVALHATSPDLVARSLNALSRDTVDAMRRAAYAHSGIVNADREDLRAHAVLTRVLASKGLVRTSLDEKAHASVNTFGQIPIAVAS